MLRASVDCGRLTGQPELRLPPRQLDVSRPLLTSADRRRRLEASGEPYVPLPYGTMTQVIRLRKYCGAGFLKSE